MNPIDYISAPLQRKLKTGTRYGKLLPFSDCSSMNFGNGENNTTEGVEFIAEMVQRHSHQVAKIAPKLKGKTVFETVQSIYGFLYNHVQYRADGQLQRLRSPACSWKQRKTGIDCKSYTIFAMCLLRAMGYSAVIRQVRQPGQNPDLWTHVYVVVPINQGSKNFQKDLNDKGKYLVVDATRHINEEVNFLEKKDKIMQSHQYIGMNAPHTRNAPAGSITEGWENFKGLLEALNKKGVSSEILKELTDYVRGLLQKGINPYMEFTLDGLKVSPSKGAPARFFAVRPRAGMNGWLDDLFSGSDNNGNGGGGSNDDSSGTDWGKLWGQVKGWFSDISLGDHISCWGGSAYGGDQIKSDINEFKRVVRSFENKINQAGKSGNWAQLSTALNDFHCALTVLHKVYMFQDNKDWKSRCSDDNFGKFRGLIVDQIGLFGDYLREIKKKFNVSSNGSTTVALRDHFSKMWSKDEMGWTSTCPAKKYTPKHSSSGDVPIIDNSSSIPTNGNNNGSGSNNNNNNNNNNPLNPGGSIITAPVNQNKANQAGFGMVPMLLLVGGTMLAWPAISKAIKTEKPKMNTKKTAKK